MQYKISVCDHQICCICRNDLCERFSALVDFVIDFVAFHVSAAAEVKTEVALSELTDKLADSLLPLLISELLRMWEDPKAKIMFPGAQRLKTARAKMLDLGCDSWSVLILSYHG